MICSCAERDIYVAKMNITAVTATEITAEKMDLTFAYTKKYIHGNITQSFPSPPPQTHLATPTTAESKKIILTHFKIKNFLLFLHCVSLKSVK